MVSGGAAQPVQDVRPQRVAGRQRGVLEVVGGVVRHAEAAQHYREALNIAPGNGVWWMGLGISLQADQHLPEAREAYTRARAANGLTPELQAFIERKLEQLAR